MPVTDKEARSLLSLIMGLLDKPERKMPIKWMKMLLRWVKKLLREREETKGQLAKTREDLTKALSENNTLKAALKAKQAPFSFGGKTHFGGAPAVGAAASAAPANTSS